ncbi:three-Cys-motif partner protein TcmP [Sabulibacter ruber]|uniref:three-Cys-motif partner protein TcmP n=1 Tax=Sabulibacter ruber TaxID=2811901 RepID=UPI001A97C501|nr:three-Cys-motif partner protein TcmP [Sabulibacter ruber]
MKETKPGSEPKEFFRQKRSAAEVKVEILSKFFPVWAEMAVATQPSCLYVELNAGTGQLEVGKPAAAPKVLRHIFAAPGSRFNLNAAFQTFFADSNKANLAALPQVLEELPFYQELENAPLLLKDQESQASLRAKLSAKTPALVVADPFGYRFSQEVLLQTLENGAGDLFLLFEASKLKASVKSAAAPGALQNLYGTQLTALQTFFERTPQAQRREDFALKSLESAIRERGYRTLVFKIGAPGKDQPYQYLLFASPSEILCTKLKEILLEYSEYQEDGVPLMSGGLMPVRLLVPEYAQYLPFSMYKLTQDLLQKASVYNRMSLEKIYEKHNVETNYCRANYMTVMEKLKEEGKILLLNPKTAQQVHKLSYSCLIKFKG